MKTYLPQVERRIVNRPNQTYGVLSYDLDNAYPQRLLEMVAAAPTAKDCWQKRTSFISGRSFEDETFGNAVINDHGLTVKKLLRGVASDKALFRGFAIHVNYNANYKISSVNYVKFEDVRMGDPDDPEHCHKLAVYPDWGRKSWKVLLTKRIQWFNRYNPNPEVIEQEVIEAGGWDQYKGQLLYFNPEINDYPLAECDSVIEDIETEAGIKIFNNRTVTTGFLPAAMLFMKGKREEADNVNPDESGYFPQGNPSQIEIALGSFQGAKNGQKIVVIEHEDENDKPELATFPIQNNDKLFEVTEKSIERRIIKGFSIPKELVNAEKASGLSNGGEKKEAIRQFNDDTADERNEISEIFKDIFGRFWQVINTSGNWTIVPTPDDVVEEVIGKTAGQNVTNLLLSPLPNYVKRKTLEVVYGIKASDAEQMVLNTDDDEKVDVEAEARAELRGSVGGVQGIIALQQSVASGQTTPESAVATLKYVYGYDEAQAKEIVGTPKINPNATDNS